jgi:hypothetical protein
MVRYCFVDERCTTWLVFGVDPSGRNSLLLLIKYHYPLKTLLKTFFVSYSTGGWTCHARACFGYQ